MQSNTDNAGSRTRARLDSLDSLSSRQDAGSRSKRQLRLDKSDEEPVDLTDRDLKMKLSDMAGQIYLRGWHRNVARLTPAEASVVAAVIIGLATSDKAIALYDDILEGNADTIGELLQTIDQAADAMKEDIEEADRRYQEREAQAWGTQTEAV